MMKRFHQRLGESARDYTDRFDQNIVMNCPQHKGISEREKRDVYANGLLKWFKVSNLLEKHKTFDDLKAAVLTLDEEEEEDPEEDPEEDQEENSEDDTEEEMDEDPMEDPVENPEDDPEEDPMEDPDEEPEEDPEEDPMEDSDEDPEEDPDEGSGPDGN